jgi:hypothetical protein
MPRIPQTIGLRASETRRPRGATLMAARLCHCALGLRFLQGPEPQHASNGAWASHVWLIGELIAQRPLPLPAWAAGRIKQAREAVDVYRRLDPPALQAG